jgi:hypothetical protein
MAVSYPVPGNVIKKSPPDLPVMDALERFLPGFLPSGSETASLRFEVSEQLYVFSGFFGKKGYN